MKYLKPYKIKNESYHDDRVLAKKAYIYDDGSGAVHTTDRSGERIDFEFSSIEEFCDKLKLRELDKQAKKFNI